MKQSSIQITKKIKLRHPVVIAAWPGMGEVALKAAIYLRDKLKAEEFASFNPEGFFQPEGVDIQDSLVSITGLPVGKFYYYKNKFLKSDLILFISEAQPLIERSYEYAQQVASFIKGLAAGMVFTFAALPSPIEHTKKPAVWATTTHKALLEQLKKLPLKFMPAGHISGLNGIMLGAAKEAGIEGICLLAEIPLYTIQIENPLASQAVLEAVTKIINIQIDVQDLQAHARLVHDEIEKLINFLKDPEAHHQPIGLDEIEKIKNSLSAFTKIPDSARKKIEGLFSEAQKDIAKANELKKELDHWNVYAEYEDRFLDLFRRSSRPNN